MHLKKALLHSLTAYCDVIKASGNADEASCDVSKAFNNANKAYNWKLEVVAPWMDNLPALPFPHLFW